MHIIQRLNWSRRKGHTSSDDEKLDIVHCIVITLKEFCKIRYVRDLKCFGIAGRSDLVNFETSEKLITELPTLVELDEIYRLAFNENGRGEFIIDFDVRKDGFSVIASIEGEYLEQIRASVLRDMEGVMLNIYSLVNECYCLAEKSAIEIFDIGYPRPQMDRSHKAWTFPKVVDYIDLNYYQELAKDRLVIAQKLTSDFNPSQVRVYRQNQLTVLHWVENLMDNEEIAQHLLQRDLWLIRQLDVKVLDESFKKQDDLEPQIKLEFHPTLTYYSPIFQIGYKAVAYNSDGTLDKGLMEEFKNWIDNQALPDGTPLSQLNILLPDREAALNIHKDALLAGIVKVLYIDKNGNWWNPNLH